MAVKAGLQLALGHFYTPNIKNTNLYISKLPPFFLISYVVCSLSCLKCYSVTDKSNQWL